MMKAESPSRTLHLFRADEVRRLTGRSRSDDDPVSLCGKFSHPGPFTGVSEDLDEVDSLCEDCKRAAEEDE